MSLIGKEWDYIVWDGEVWKDPIEAENFVTTDYHGFISPEQVIFPCSAEDILTPLPPYILSFSPLEKLILQFLATQQ